VVVVVVVVVVMKLNLIGDVVATLFEWYCNSPE
jgi:hypothetical protein